MIRFLDNLSIRNKIRLMVTLFIWAMRYEENEYFWLYDLGKPYPAMIMHPAVPVLDGKVLDAEISISRPVKVSGTKRIRSRPTAKSISSWPSWK